MDVNEHIYIKKYKELREWLYSSLNYLLNNKQNPNL